MEIETVKIVVPATADIPDGFIVINKSDLTADMVVYKEPAPEKDAGKKTSK